MPTQEKSAVPTDVTATGEDDGTTTVAGKGTPGATVEVKNPDGDVIGTGKVGDDGDFTITLPKGKAKPGDELSVTETEPGKTPSDPATATVTAPKGDDGNTTTTPTQETSKTPSGVAVKTADDGGVYVDGNGTPGATVEVKDPHGNVIGTGTVDDNGKFEVHIPEGVVKPGDELGVTETEPGKKPSAAVSVKVPGATTAVKTTQPATQTAGTIVTKLGNTAGDTAAPSGTTVTAAPLAATPSATVATPLAATPSATVATPVSATTAGTQAAAPATGTATTASELPATGDDNAVAIAAFGGALVLGLIGLAGNRRKREI